MANQVPAPPYTPGFGRRPPVVAGRDALVDDVARVLEVGPEHPRFCRALLGSRGTGKTVLLDVIGEVASKELGWAVLHVQALQEESLVAVLLQRIPEAVRPWERFGRGSKDLQAQLNVGVDLGVARPRPSSEAITSAPGAPPLPSRTHWDASGASPPVTAPGCWSRWTRPKWHPRRTSRRSPAPSRRWWPVGSNPWPSSSAGSRPSGSAWPALGPTPAASRSKSSATWSRARRAWPWSSRRPAATWPGKTRPSACWCAARAVTPTTCSCSAGTPGRRPRGRPRSPSPTPKPGCVRPGPSWRASTKSPGASLRPQERDYLAAVASLAGTGGAGVEEVAKVLGKEPKQLAVARDRLVHMHGLLEVPERAQVRFVDAEMAEWVAERPDGTSTTTTVQRGPARSAGQGRGRPSSSPSQDAAAVRAPPAGRRAAPGPRALTPRAPGPRLRGQFRPAVLLAATCAIRRAIKLTKANS